MANSTKVKNYTKLNLRGEVEDQAPKFDMSPDMEYRPARVALDLENSGVSFFRLEPNFRVPFGHTHNEQEEVYIVVDGSARLKLDDEILELKPWDAVRISKETMRNLEGGPDGVEILLFGAPNAGSGDAQMQQGWWTD
jgi:mannose-6-phosphate isomerase-like protein (cupin superfamily)